MPEYIEREALLELVEHLDKNERCKNCYLLSSCDAWVRNATTLYDDYIYSVENCPYYISTADVVEVEHGEWKDDLFVKNKYPSVKCSECNIRFCDIISNHSCMWNFCPNCGAKMDGERKGD